VKPKNHGFIGWALPILLFKVFLITSHVIRLVITKTIIGIIEIIDIVVLDVIELIFIKNNKHK
jgi:hypothetical protein